MERQSLSCKSAGVEPELGRAPSPSTREVLLMIENSAVAGAHGKVTCPWWVQFRLMRLMVVLYQALLPGFGPSAHVLPLDARAAKSLRRHREIAAFMRPHQ